MPPLEIIVSKGRSAHRHSGKLPMGSGRSLPRVQIILVTKTMRMMRIMMKMKRMVWTGITKL
jgi:hypothetical protein